MDEVEGRVVLIIRKYKAQGFDDPSATLKIINEFGNQILHPNHFHILIGLNRVAEHGIRLIKTTEQYVSGFKILPSRFNLHRRAYPKYLDVFERIMNLYDIVQPGTTHIYSKIIPTTYTSLYSGVSDWAVCNSKFDGHGGYKKV